MIDLPPVEQLQLELPDDLTLGELFAIRAATGIDVQEPPSGIEQVTALLWFALKQRDPEVTWSQMHQLKARQLEPYWTDLKTRSIAAAADAMKRAAAADQAKDEAEALADQRFAMGEPDPEPVPPAVDPT